jgi:hypothetical protein
MEAEGRQGVRPLPPAPGSGSIRRAWPPEVQADAAHEPARRTWPPKPAAEPTGPRPARLNANWDDPPELRRDPHEHDFDRRRRETAASPTASELDLDHPPLAYGRDRPFDPEPPLQLDVWSAYEQIQRTRLGPDEQTEPDAPVARRGPGRADLSGAASASHDEHPARGTEPEDEPAAVEGQVASRSLGTARRPERPRPPEQRERGTAMLRGRAPARPAPPAPARQPDAPSLRRARRPSRLRDESPTSEYLAVEGSSDDPERS